MNDYGDIHSTARDWFLAKIVNGEQPEVVVGGPRDGLRYFSVTVDGDEYWLAEQLLVTPPSGGRPPLGGDQST
jgi:hypothetical protein